MIKQEYAGVAATARAVLKGGFNLAVAVAVLSHANQQLPKPSDVAVFLRNRQWNTDALHMYRAPETVMRAYFTDTLGADFKKSTAARGFSNGRTLYARHIALVEMACNMPEGRNAPWGFADKCKALAAALAAEKVTNEAELQRFCEKVGAAKPDKTEQEKAATALAAMLKHGAALPEFLTLAASAISAAQSGNLERMAELLAAAATVAPQAPGVSDEIPLGLPERKAA